MATFNGSNLKVKDFNLKVKTIYASAVGEPLKITGSNYWSTFEKRMKELQPDTIKLILATKHVDTIIRIWDILTQEQREDIIQYEGIIDKKFDTMNDYRKRHEFVHWLEDLIDRKGIDAVFGSTELFQHITLDRVMKYFDKYPGDVIDALAYNPDIPESTLEELKLKKLSRCGVHEMLQLQGRDGGNWQENDFDIEEVLLVLKDRVNKGTLDFEYKEVK